LPTLDDPEKFAYWLETRGTLKKIGDKEVFLTKKQFRAVPLIHYNFITTTNGVNKVIKDKSVQDEIKKIINKPIIIQDDKGKFNDLQFQNINKILKIFEKNEIRVKRSHTLNKVSEYLFNNDMLPALCYVFSRKQLEKCAEELTTNLLEFDSKIPYIVDRECELIIRKLPNFEEYLNLPEYVNTVKLLRKGVGIHHAGLMPILREMTELLFSKGFVKILFCTETMSVGINLPVKTTIFTDIKKFNGEVNRLLFSHEYIQAAGRAGRLGLDTVGHVIHLNNLFRNIDTSSYKLMMSGKSQCLTSKFKISYNLLLNLIEIGDNNLVDFIKKSMVTGDLNSQMGEIYNKIVIANKDLDNILDCYKNIRTPYDILEQFLELKKIQPNVVNKKRKEVDRNIENLVDMYKFLDSDLLTYNKINKKKNEILEYQSNYDNLNNFFHLGVNNVLNLLQQKKYIDIDEKNITLTFLGKIACQIKEIPCLIFANLIEEKILDDLTSSQLVSLFSCFTNITVQDEYKSFFPNSLDKNINNILNKINKLFQDSICEDSKNNINSGVDYNIHFDLLNYTKDWCDANTVEDCKLIIQKLNIEKEIFLGEFVKAILKINNISSEMEKIAELTGNILFLSKLKEIPNLTLKFVVTNQSLYV
jgi:superfamily II RNA helicase